MSVSLYSKIACVCLAMACAAVSASSAEIVLQVEDFEGPWRRQTNISGFLGTGFCTSNANPDIADTAMTGTATIPEARRYAVWVRAYTSENSRRALQAHINGTPLAKTHTGSQLHWSWQKAGEIDLEAGETVVEIRDADDGYESADAVMLTSSLDSDPGETDRQWYVYNGEIPEEANALRFVIDACCAKAQQRTEPKDKAEWDTKAPEIKRELAKALGLDPMPEKTPLNARVTGKAERPDCFIENVVFESRPNFLVTANVYVPKNVDFPAPAIVVVPGHAMEDGKNYGLYMRAQLGLTRLGCIVLGYDPIGQGERKLPGFEHKMGYGSLLVGQTNEGMIVWDTMRAVDYLLTRPDVDPERLGLTGNSGGGENTFYTMPLEERFAAAASFSFVCSYEDWIRDGGNHCICNHLPGILNHMEEFEIIGLNAPRPFLAGNGAEDKIFPIAGTRSTCERARRIYAMYDAAERMANVEAPLGHGWSDTLREAAYGWMSKWLLGKGDGGPMKEEAFDIEAPKSPEVLCFDGDMIPSDSETVVTLNQKRAEELREAYNTPPKDNAAWHERAEVLRAAIWEVFGGHPAAFPPKPRTINTFDWNGCRVETLAITTEPGMQVAALFLKPEKAPEKAPTAIYLPKTDKQEARGDRTVEELLSNGWCVLALDPRGMGETKGSYKENQIVSDAVHLGRPLFAQRVWDVLQATRYLKTRADVNSARLRCIGNGPSGVLALFAAALGGEFETVEALTPLASFRYFIENDQPQPLWLCVPNILKVADVAQAAALAAPTAVRIVEAVGYGNQPLELDAARNEFAFAQTVYELEGLAKNFVLK
ncbi:MAG: acetylxylan esterase [Candidatus Hydrogenedentota bacterium]